MSDARTAAGFDRLPWLEDVPERPARSAPGRLTGWIVAALLLFAGASYWLVARTANRPATPAAPVSVPHSSTISLPSPQTAQPEVQPNPVPEVEPAPIPTASIPTAEPKARGSRSRTRVVVHRNSTPSRRPDERPAKVASPSRPGAAYSGTGYPPLWPSRVSQGASGRLVQIGAFGTRLQAKRGWSYMVRAYPAVKRLPAVVVTARNSRGRLFYRFQIGTTSQAHSEVLCQRMQRIRFSCAVVGLPGERKAVER